MAKAFNLFDSVAVPDYGESQFSGNHSVTTSAKFGTIEPMECLNYYPGDNIRMKYNTEVNFPPLLSPSYQRFKMNQYTFKVRKGLLFQNDDYQKFLLSAGGNDLSSVPIHPSIPFSSQNLYGEAVVVFRFNSTLPVFTLQGTDGMPYLQMNELPDVPSWNMFFRKLYLNAQSGNLHVDFTQDEQIYYWNQFFKSIEIELIDGSDTFTQGKVAFVNNQFATFNNNVPANGINLKNPSNWSLVFHSAVAGGNNNHTSYLKLDSSVSRMPSYVMPPILNPKSLMEKLGYPSNNIYLDDLAFSAIRQFCFSLSESDAPNGLPSYTGLSQWTTASIAVSRGSYYSRGAFYGDSTEMTRILCVKPGEVATGYIDPLSLLQRFLDYSIFNGSAGGALVPHESQCVIISMPLNALVAMSTISDSVETTNLQYYEDKKMDSCRLVGYHAIWNEYFRDANLTDAIPLYKSHYAEGTESKFAFENDEYNTSLRLLPSSYESFKDWSLQKLIEYNRSDASQMKYYDGTYLDVLDIRDWMECCVMLMYRLFEIPKKCIDRNYFTSALPSVAKVQVFAPVVPSMPSNGATVDKSQIPDYTPVFASMAPDNTTFMSIDAFRTANIMESFYINANLAGPRPVSFVLMMFGEHSQDFRMEIPVLVDASSSPLQIQELTQQSETAQLPLGYQASKMTAFKGRNDDFVTIDSEGDQGYIYTLYSIVPEIDFVGGFDKKLLCDNVFQTTFFPQFGILGEEVIKKYELQASPRSLFSTLASGQGYSLNDTYGYCERYANYKYMPSSVHGRFLTDMRFWHSARIFDSFTTGLILSQAFLAVDSPERMFVEEDAENCFVYSVCECEFSRKLPTINPTKLL